MWHAWLRIDGSLAADAIGGSGPWRSLLSGTGARDHVLFENRVQFKTGPVGTKWSNEQGDAPTFLFAWTGANVDERPFDRACVKWTSDAGNKIGKVGRIATTDIKWDDAEPLFCDLSFSLYCFEQP